ncbi:sigma-E factor negative regulatory protein RseA [Tahibacter aquaticus]|uniref:Sigma-E factor negative regulatory protein RseA n=1 Tax=Tahibacter aquaticus TaxID=520092 RepID=A0A4R6YNY7_9GAMM|nr:sigma-E factor negative regulatory protein [Tahibacter aquaticus]TDR39385.1 sigma-E factor negative regulatory protein RseA [Tahibacter aquaticus]
MSTDIKEQLSALMDGEIERDAARFALRSAAGERALAASWSRYHVARDCLKGQPVLLADAGFASAIMARIDAEDAAGQGRGGGSRWMRYLSGGAVAAAVAVVALIASAPESETGPNRAVGSGVTVAASPRTPLFNDSLVRSGGPQLAQPASATVGGDTFFAPAYDLRSQPSNNWRPVDPAQAQAAMRSPNAPYVLLLVPMQSAVPADKSGQPRLQ